MKEYTEEYKKLSSGQVIKEIKSFSDKGKLYAKTTLYYNDEGVVYRVIEWVQNKDKSITYDSRHTPHFNCFGELKLIYKEYD